ncbi:hypothetical protein [Sphingomicrobium marinum]|uniref:hypothetical protein n=1 Tax=Sphingomicrobium marinum TaxID=1227950 RepID=UPI0022404897|nr:hypothetical protein [Sphingomicrobium marinum]
MIPLAAIALTACDIVEQPESAETVAAYEVYVPSADDKARLHTIFENTAQNHGFHLDAASSTDLDVMSQVSRISFNASIWRGENDDEIMMSAMDFEDRLGRVWMSFPKGEDPSRSTRFRNDLMKNVKSEFPETLSLPIMPTGAIPLTRDLIRTEDGYIVDPAEAHRYK